jgi:hypothetical protein
MPGEPAKEKCNLPDDDCDGLTDEDLDLCPTGQTCAAGSCVDSDTVSLEPMSTPGGGSNPGSSGAGNLDPSPMSGATSSAKKNDSSGCALGARAGHGALAMLMLLMAASLWRRRGRARLS